MDGYICKICSKNYSSYKSLWNHNKKFHDLSYTHNIPNISSKKESDIPNLSSLKEDNNKCIKCKKQLSSYKNKWRHEKTCNKINENVELKQMLNNILKQCKIHPKTLHKINKQLINNNTVNNINNGTINTINIVKFVS